MIRTIFVHGSLRKANNKRRSFMLNVDNQNQLFAAMRARSAELNLALRKHDLLAIWTTDEAGEDVQPIAQGFNFGTAPIIHICPHTEGAYGSEAILIWAVVAAVVISVATTMLMSHMNTNSNGSGGGKSTMFNGITNTTDQGGAIPIPYGKRLIIGSTIIASDEDYVNLI
jgi:predicted phage tail protein